MALEIGGGITIGGGVTVEATGSGGGGGGGGGTTTTTYTSGTDYTSWSFNGSNSTLTIMSAKGTLLPALQAGIPSGAVLTIPAAGMDPEYVFTLTSGITYDMFAAGGSGAWTATWTLTSNNSWGAGNKSASSTITVTF